MDSEQGIEQQQQQQTQMCQNNCGFFANNNCTGLCSKCYRERVAREAHPKTLPSAPAPASTAQPTVAPPAPALAAPAVEQPSSSPSSAASGDASSSTPASPSPKTSTRCFCCRKKVGLTGFKCKCGELFCGSHRYAESHNCSFDYKSTQRQKLAENNPVVQASKVQKI